MTPVTISIKRALKLAEIVPKRIANLRKEVVKFATRSESIVDPLAKTLEGGSEEYIRRIEQRVTDLTTWLLAVRTAIMKYNLENSLTVLGKTHTIAEWLIWMRELKKGDHQHYRALESEVENARYGQRSSGTRKSKEEDTEQLVVNINEVKLARDRNLLSSLEAEVWGAIDDFNAGKKLTLGPPPTDDVLAA